MSKQSQIPALAELTCYLLKSTQQNKLSRFKILQQQPIHIQQKLKRPKSTGPTGKAQGFEPDRPGFKIWPSKLGQVTQPEPRLPHLWRKDTDVFLSELFYRLETMHVSTYSAWHKIGAYWPDIQGPHNQVFACLPKWYSTNFRFQ